MKRLLAILIFLLLAGQIQSQTEKDFEQEKVSEEKKEFKFIGYYFMRSELSNTYPTNEFLKGQIVGRLFGGKIMATYEATGRGYMDNLCYVFNVRKGVRDLEVRVCGTFTVEEVR